MSARRRVSLLFSNQAVLTVLAVIILGHVLVTFSYLRESSLNSQAIKRNAVIQKIINAIYTVEATPVLAREKAVSAMEDPDIKVTLTTEPNPDALRFQQVSYWNISRALRGDLTGFNLSIEMQPQQWLDIRATLYHHVLYKQLFLLFLEVLIFATVFISAWSIRRFTLPLKNFKEAAERLGIDLHTRPLDIYGPPVVKEAAQAINQMQHRIQDLIRDRTQMLAALSHDLRTPITRMKLRSQFVGEPQLQSKFVSDLDEMSQMITEVLAFARDEANSEERVRFDLISLLDTMIDEYRSVGKSVAFSCEMTRTPLLGRPIAIKRALNNIVNNALRYASDVSVSVRLSGQQVVVEVADDGPGIDEEEIEQVFEPFYRGEKSRNRDTGGVGLGLAVTRDILFAHGGSITLRNRQPRGLCVRIQLPMTRSDSN